MSVVFSSVLDSSPAWKGRSPEFWVTIASSFDRLRRLIGSNLEFFQDDRYSETTAIIDRCIIETCSKIIWLCEDPNEERLELFIQGSLKNDREHRRKIEENVRLNGGRTTAIEKRMLDRMSNFEARAGTAAIADRDLKQMPNLYNIMRENGEDRYAYVAIGKIASHAVHGNWQHLYERHMKFEDGRYTVQFNYRPSNPVQFFLPAVYVLEAGISYIESCFDDAEALRSIIELCRSAIDKSGEVYREAVADDYREV